MFNLQMVEVFGTQLPEVLLTKLLGPSSILPSYRFSHCAQVSCFNIHKYHLFSPFFFFNNRKEGLRQYWTLCIKMGQTTQERMIDLVQLPIYYVVVTGALLRSNSYVALCNRFTIK